MADNDYIIYGSEYSPFSVKVRSYFRYKQIAHEWRPRTKDNMADYQKHAKLPLIPLVLQPEGNPLQDSTPIIEKLEERYTDLSLQPSDPTCHFLSILIEEYADEWGNKPMFHYRWWRDVDQIAVANGLAEGIIPNASDEEKAAFSAQLRERMVPRLSFVGSSEQNKETIETSLDQLLAALEKHLEGRSYLFGERPALGDFGLYAQLYGCTQQPTTEAMIKAHPNVDQWIARMLNPEKLGEWEDWDALKETLQPLVKEQVGALYMPWAIANAKALMAEEPTFTVELMGRDFTQDTMKYTGRSLSKLKVKFQNFVGNGALEEFLLSTDCLQPLASESW